MASTTKRKTTPAAKRGRPPKNSVAKSWAEDGELGVTEAIIKKYADIIDSTNSGRDMKPLASGLFEAIDRYKQISAAKGEDAGKHLAPVYQILNQCKAANDK